MTAGLVRPLAERARVSEKAGTQDVGAALAVVACRGAFARRGASVPGIKRRFQLVVEARASEQNKCRTQMQANGASDLVG